MKALTRLSLSLLCCFASVHAARGETEPVRSAFLREWTPRVVAEPENFWRAVEARGTPLVESSEDDARFVHVTFLYRGDSSTRSIAVIALEAHQLANYRYFALGRLARLGSSEVWYRTYRLRSDARFTYRLSLNDERLWTDVPGPEWQTRLSALTRDPLNKRPTTTRDGAVSGVELPTAPPLRWFEPVAGTAAGRLESAQVGDPGRGLDHAVSVYTPAGFSKSIGARNLLIVLDGEGVPSFVPVPTILDNLHSAGLIGATVAVMLHNRPGKRLADLSYSPELVAFVRDELLPWMRMRYAAPRDPRRVVVAGRSASGNTALFLAFELSSLIGNAISQSGGYGLGAPGTRTTPTPGSEGLTEDDFPQNEWLTRRIALAPRRPIRVHVEVGTLEDVAWEFPFPQYATPTVLLANRHLRDVLDAKGYELRYHEYNGPHDSMVWRGTFGDALVSLVGAGPKRETATRP